MSESLIEQLRLRLRDLEIDAVAIRGRIEELGELIALLEKRRGGRPKVFHTNEVLMRPTRVGGGINPPDTDPPEAAE